MRKQILFPGLLLFTALFQLSCDKQNGITASTFYGRWKTSYNDTVEFSKIGGKDMIRYDLTMNPSMPMNSFHEFTYRDNKLGIKDGLSGLATYRFYQSFRWLEEGRSFEIQGIEWFPFLSSTGTYFTFTRIP
jgi:hypothetical protein